MKHKIHDECKVFRFDLEPFPAYRFEFPFFGSKPRFLPTMDPELLFKEALNHPPGQAPLLKDGFFSVIKSKKSGMRLIIPQMDRSNRTLLFVSLSIPSAIWWKESSTHEPIVSCNSDDGYAAVLILSPDSCHWIGGGTPRQPCCRITHQPGDGYKIEKFDSLVESPYWHA